MIHLIDGLGRCFKVNILSGPENVDRHCYTLLVRRSSFCLKMWSHLLLLGEISSQNTFSSESEKCKSQQEVCRFQVADMNSTEAACFESDFCVSCTS